MPGWGDRSVHGTNGHWPCLWPLPCPDGMIGSNLGGMCTSLVATPRMLSPCGARQGPRPLPVSCSESSAQMCRQRTFAGSTSVSSLGLQGPVDGAPLTTSCSDLAAPPAGEREKAAVGQWRRLPHKGALQRQRERKRERDRQTDRQTAWGWRDVAALDFKRTDKMERGLWAWIWI